MRTRWIHLAPLTPLALAAGLSAAATPTPCWPSAALQAQALGSALDRHSVLDPALPRAQYRQAAEVVANPWQVAASADLAYPQATGTRPPGTDLLNRYLARVVRASHTSPEVCDAVSRVQHLLAPPSSLLHPAMVARVMRDGRRQRAARPVPAPSAVTP